MCVRCFLYIVFGSVAPARGRLPPLNVEKDGPRNSSKFDEKIGGGGGVNIHLRNEKIINTKYFYVTIFCTVFLLRGCYSELRNQRSTAFYCKMRETANASDF